VGLVLVTRKKFGFVA